MPGHRNPLGWCPQPGGRRRRAPVRGGTAIHGVCAEVPGVARGDSAHSKEPGPTQRGKKRFSPKKEKIGYRNATAEAKHKR